MFGIEDALAEVVASASQPALGAIKLAWWREALERLDVQPPPPEPRLQAAASQLLQRGITGRELSHLEEGWAVLLDAEPDAEVALDRGARLFSLAGRLLGDGSVEGLDSAGRLYAAGDLHRRKMALAPLFVATKLPRFPKRLRPLTAMAALARRDLREMVEPEGTPARAWTLLRHRLTGR